MARGDGEIYRAAGRKLWKKGAKLLVVLAVFLLASRCASTNSNATAIPRTYNPQLTTGCTLVARMSPVAGRPKPSAEQLKMVKGYPLIFESTHGALLVGELYDCPSPVSAGGSR